MKRYLIAPALFVTLGLLSACGGGGGGSSSPATKAVVKAYLFGNMSTNCRVSDIHTSFVVPTGIMVNYSTPAPASFPANVYPLRGGTVVPAGPVALSQAIYNTTTGVVTIDMSLAGTSWNLASSSTGEGALIGDIDFKLATPGTLPNLPVPWTDPSAVVNQIVPTIPVISILPATGLQVNLKTSFQ